VFHFITVPAFAQGVGVGGIHGGTVFRMDCRKKDFVGCGAFLRRHAEDAVGFVAPDQAVVRQVQMPTADMGNLLGQGQHRRTFPQRLLGQFALGDVQRCADITDNLSRSVAVWMGAVVHDPRAAVRAQEPMLQFEDRTAFQTSLECVVQQVPVIRVNGLREHGCVVGRSGAGLKTIDAKLLVRPRRLASCCRIFPAAEVGDLLGLGQKAPHFLQLPCLEPGVKQTEPQQRQQQADAGTADQNEPDDAVAQRKMAPRQLREAQRPGSSSEISPDLAG